MKQHEFDNWIKESISKHEESAKNIEWNKTDVFDSIVSMQNSSKSNRITLKYAVAAIIIVLLSLNAFQLYKLNIIQEKSDLLARNFQNVESTNDLLTIELEKVNAELIYTKENNAELIDKISHSEATINNLSSKLSKPVILKEVEYITKVVHDTIYIEPEPINPLLAQNEIHHEVSDNESFQEQEVVGDFYKPLVHNEDNPKRRFLFRIKLGTNQSDSRYTKKEPNIILSADL
jgi:hypothetical protein